MIYFNTRRRSFAEHWKYFVARFNDVHAFGYNSAGSERIWMKFGELRIYCLELALTDFGRDPRRSGVYCGQMAGWIKMPLGTEVGLSADDIVLDDTYR